MTLKRMLLSACALLIGCDERVSSRVDLIVQAIERGTWRQLPQMLPDQALTDIAKEPDLAQKLVGAISAQTRRMGSDPEAARTVVELILRLAQMTHRLHPERPVAADCVTQARLFQARVARLLGDAVDHKAFEEAVAALERDYAAEPRDGEDAAAAVMLLLEAARSCPGEGAAFRERALKLVDAARVKHALSIPVTVASSSCRVDMARHLADRDPKTAKAHLDAALEELALEVSAKSPDLDVATAHAEAVRAARMLPKLRVKADYRMVPHACAQSFLRFQVPLSRCWTVDVRARDDLGAIYCRDADGTVRRIVGLDCYRWDRAYGTVGGDNIKGLARDQQAGSVRALNAVKSTKDLAKGRLNRKISSAYFYEVVGTNDGGKPTRMRHYFFKSKKRQVTFSVAIYEVGEPDDIEPAMEEIIESLEEIG
ncbi:MAG: hypothetical protein ACT4PV_06955 [Planctomycetaceae bacterium]